MAAEAVPLQNATELVLPDDMEKLGAQTRSARVIVLPDDMD